MKNSLWEIQIPNRWKMIKPTTQSISSFNLVKAKWCHFLTFSAAGLVFLFSVFLLLLATPATMWDQFATYYQLLPPTIIAKKQLFKISFFFWRQASEIAFCDASAAKPVAAAQKPVAAAQVLGEAISDASAAKSESNCSGCPTLDKFQRKTKCL